MQQQPRAVPRPQSSGWPNRWWQMARLGTVGFVLLLIGVALSGIPAYYTLLIQRLCSGDACLPGQLTAEELQALYAVGFSRSAYAVFTVGYNLLTAFGFFALAVVLIWRTSADWYVLLIALVFLSLGISFPTVALWGRYPALDMLISLAWASSLPIVSLFPNGHFVPRYTRVLVPVWCLVLVHSIVFPAASFGVGTWPALLRGTFMVSCWLLALAAQIYRYRRMSGPVERQQTKWVIFSMLAVIFGVFAILLLGMVIPSLQQPGPARAIYGLLSDALITALLLLIPLSIGMAILRYRLFEIDIIINRTLVYGTLTGLLATVYVGSVVLLQRVLGPFIGDNDQITIVGSTLAVAALFQPLRRRIQGLIDRRFYRRKYDAQQTLQAFSARLRDETDVQQLTDDMVQVVQETLQPAHVSLWLKPLEREVR